MSHHIKRRQFCFLLGSSVFIHSALGNSAGDFGSSSAEGSFISAASDSADRHWVTGFSLGGGRASTQFKHPLPGRAHHIAVHKDKGVFVVVARRPGRFLLVGDLFSGEILQQINVPDDRHLLGHGIFSTDGSSFYTVESAYQNLQGDNGRVVSWNVSGKGSSIAFSRSHEFTSYGIGPHELLLMPDQNTLVIANGGIRTHPDSGREKLNLDTMQPSLVYLDRKSGALLEQHQFAEEYHQASIRHLDVNEQGVVALSMQYEGEPFSAVALVATHRQGEALRTLDIPLQVQQQMKQYVGSVRFDNSGRYFAASCPRGNMITFWDIEAGEYLDSVRSRDGCGISATQNGFVFTAGTGRISHYNLEEKKLNVLAGSGNKDEKIFWDNHLSMAL